MSATGTPRMDSSRFAPTFSGARNAASNSLTRRKPAGRKHSHFTRGSMKRKQSRTQPLRSRFCASIQRAADESALLGFVSGGKLAWLLSVRFKPDCAVGYYGVSVEKTLNEANNLGSPLMLHIGGKDQYC